MSSHRIGLRLDIRITQLHGEVHQIVGDEGKIWLSDLVRGFLRGRRVDGPRGAVDKTEIHPAGGNPSIRNTRDRATRLFESCFATDCPKNNRIRNAMVRRSLAATVTACQNCREQIRIIAT